MYVLFLKEVLISFLEWLSLITFVPIIYERSNFLSAFRIVNIFILAVLKDV